MCFTNQTITRHAKTRTVTAGVVSDSFAATSIQVYWEPAGSDNYDTPMGSRNPELAFVVYGGKLEKTDELEYDGRRWNITNYNYFPGGHTECTVQESLDADP